MRGPHSAGSIVLTALAAGLGLLVTATVTLARQSPALGDSRHAIGVLTLDDLHEGQVELAGAMVLILVAAVLWERLRRIPTRGHLLLFAALCTLALDNLVSALFTAGFDSLATSRFATWATTSVGLVSALLLLLAAWLPDEPLPRPRLALGRTALTTGASLALLVVLAWLLRGDLPAAFTREPETPAELTYLAEHPSLVAGEAMAAVSCAIAGVMFTVSARRRQDVLTGWIGIACTLLAVSYANYALVPSHFTELLFLGDYFFMAAVLALLVGAVVEVGATEAALIDSTLYAERRRIAREMHDGVAQELALIASQAHAISATSDAEVVARSVRRIQDAVDRARDQSQRAITELSGPLDARDTADDEQDEGAEPTGPGTSVAGDGDPSSAASPDVRADTVTQARVP
jgi:signal transduction histidine kinase